MIRPNFLTTADRLELLSCVKRQREDHGVARRANALLLLDDGMSCSQIAKVLFLDDDLCPKFPPALRGVLGVKSLALGRHLVHRLSLQKFHRCQVAQC